jgi:uncharacterized protein YdiU (UPF0061 family)
MVHSQIHAKSLETLTFNNRFLRDLPADSETANHPRQVLGACYSRVQPAKVASPQLVAYAEDVAEQLDLTREVIESDDFGQVFSGNRLLPGMDPYAMCYGGHQFGSWAGQLGDGRAINLGELVNRRGEHWTLQLKGAGPTPYSRTADGLAVLRSSLREFLCSEAMHHLGVPTTRALSLVVTGEQVVRDMFYAGNPELEPGAIVCRVAPSFTRFGNFQLFAARGEIDLLRQLVDYTIRTDFPHLANGNPPSQKAVYTAWFEDVCSKTVAMIVQWMRVGFVHGVMNTDNMSILGLTLDYGPYGWLEDYDPDWTPNTTDAGLRRYRYGQQPRVALWNLAQFANAIYPLIEAVEPLQDALNRSSDMLTQGLKAMMAQKLGLTVYEPGPDDELMAELQTILQLVETDMTLFYRNLSRVGTHVEPEQASAASAMTDVSLMAPLLEAYYRPEQLTPEHRSRISNWLRCYVTRARKDGTPDTVRRDRMSAVNPKYVLRNYLAQLAIDRAEQGDYTMIHDLQALLRRPYDEQPDQEAYAQKRPDWARHRAGCSMLSCSS